MYRILADDQPADVSAAAPADDTAVNDTAVNDTAVNDTAVNDTPESAE
jgi:hypothetical protein